MLENLRLLVSNGRRPRLVMRPRHLTVCSLILVVLMAGAKSANAVIAPNPCMLLTATETNDTLGLAKPVLLATAPLKLSDYASSFVLSGSAYIPKNDDDV